MRKLELSENSNIVGGEMIDRLFKQWYKCIAGSSYACGRVNRMAARHGFTPSQEYIDNY